MDEKASCRAMLCKTVFGVGSAAAAAAAAQHSHDMWWGITRRSGALHRGRAAESRESAKSVWREQQSLVHSLAHFPKKVLVFVRRI